MMVLWRDVKAARGEPIQVTMRVGSQTRSSLKWHEEKVEIVQVSRFIHIQILMKVLEQPSNTCTRGQGHDGVDEDAECGFSSQSSMF